MTSLRELDFFMCAGITLASLEGLFSTSVQGCLLKVRVDSLRLQWELHHMRERVLAQRGSRDTPALVFR
jgi:hypothetical protein